jgi:hypothetical protein
LDAFEPGVDGSGQGLGQGRFAGAWKIFKQDMTAAGQGGQEFASGARLAPNHLADVGGYCGVDLPGPLRRNGSAID